VQYDDAGRKLFVQAGGIGHVSEHCALFTAVLHIASGYIRRIGRHAHVGRTGCCGLAEDFIAVQCRKRGCSATHHPGNAPHQFRAVKSAVYIQVHQTVYRAFLFIEHRPIVCNGIGLQSMFQSMFRRCTLTFFSLFDGIWR